MDDIVIPARNDPQFQYVVAQFGGPAFMRRAQRAEAALATLLDQLRQTRWEWLEMSRLRLGQLHALAGGWERLGRFVAPDSLAALRGLFDELKPTLRVPLAPTGSDMAIRAAVRDLQEALDRFNQRWRQLLATTDLTEVNRRRDEYNRYYVLEKECLVGSPRIAKQGFRPLAMVTNADLAKWLPEMPANSFKLEANRTGHR
jgi:hypothetical protein